MRARALREVLAIALAATLSSACPRKEAGTGAAGSAPPGPFTRPFACPDLYEELRRELKADYVADFEYMPPLTAGNARNGVGTACRSATDVEGCKQRVATITPGSDERGLLWHRCGGCVPVVNSLLVTRGDDVLLMSSQQALLKLLGPVDTAADALLVAMAQDYQPACEAPWIRTRAEGFEILATKLIDDCPVTYADVHVLVGRDGSLRELERVARPSSGACVGRRPAGLRRARGVQACASVVGSYFAENARLEAASVAAFDVLAAELRAHGAPARLVAAAGRARRDEVAHAAAVGALARRFGATAAAPRVRRGPIRSLRTIAIENAREGCVRETWGALEASWQAAMAGDAGVRRCMRSIARDETRHAALSWQVAAWAERHLDEGGRRAVRAARAESAAALAHELTRARHPELLAVAGLPDAASTRSLLGQLRARLWHV